MSTDSVRAVSRRLGGMQLKKGISRSPNESFGILWSTMIVLQRGGDDAGTASMCCGVGDLEVSDCEACSVVLLAEVVLRGAGVEA